MDRKSLQLWLDKYVEAWRTYDPAQIGDLFSEDALYFYSPWDEDSPARGREAIVADWRKEPDSSGSWEARYDPVAVEGNVGVAQGRTLYFQPDGTVKRQFDNIFVLHFDHNGRCERFTEWYMRPRSAQQTAGS
ncbi:MAG: nuclear transport factor 2 family protein [Pyrinomonadaceae bacterium]